MVKTRYTGYDPNDMARVGPQGPDGKEIPVNLVYDQVMIAAKYSQEDCSLDSLIDVIDKEYAFDSMYQCTLSSNLSPTELVKICHRRPSASTSEPRSWSVSGYHVGM